MSVKTEGAVVDISGTASLTNMSNSGVGSSSTLSTAGALVRLRSVGKSHNIGVCAFQYTSATAKVDSPAIRFEASGQTAILVNNTLSLLGTGSANAIMYDVGSTPILVVGNNRAVASTASTIQSGAVISPLNYVGETVGSGVVQSISGTAPISVDSTNPAIPVISLNTSGTVSVQKVSVSGTGGDYSTFGTYPRIGGSYVSPTQPQELAPVKYVDDKPIGVATFNTLVGDVVLSAGTNISLGTVGNTITVNNTAPTSFLPLAGGTMAGNIEFAGTYNASNVNALTATTVLGSNFVQAGTAGFLGFKASGGSGVQTYSLVYEDATGPSSLGMKRCKLDTSNAIVAGSTGFLYDQFYNQTVAIPFATSGASFIAPIGTSITNSLTKIITQSINPNLTAWNFLTARQWGILGNFTLITASARPMRFTMTYQKNGGTERTMASTYIQNNAYMTVPVNNISFGTAEPTLSANDTLTINIYAQTIVSLDTTTIATAVPFISAIVSPMNYNS
jgi:hypothetical protein